MPTFIFGHRNPDTDSVCSAISLSYLLNIFENNTIPKVLGHINLETKFALDYFKVKEPDYLNDTKVQIRNINYNKKALINENKSILKAFLYMQKNNLTGIPIVDNKKHLTSLVTLKEMAKYFLNTNIKTVDTSFDNIIEALNGEEILRFDDRITGNIVDIYQNKLKFTNSDILIIGDNYDIADFAINSKVKLIIVTSNLNIPKKLLKKAQKNKVNMIITKYSIFDATNKTILSNEIKSIIPLDPPITVTNKDYRTDFLSMSCKVGHTNYPVVNNKNECLGLLKVTNTDDYEKIKVIMVDHNSFDQSAIGIDEAEILEIIDHHNLGGVGTHAPINFRSMPVGATCTIIYFMFVEKKVAIPKDIAGIMLSAILSDTLILKSPTTTDKDIEAATKLAKIAKVNLEEYGYLMFKAGTSVKGKTASSLINQDFKSYSVGNRLIGISQVMTMDFNEINNNINEYIDKLDELSSSSYLCAVLFITDIYKNGSYVIYDKNAKNFIKDAFDLKEVYEGVFIPDLISRKKQMLPSLLDAIEKQV